MSMTGATDSLRHRVVTVTRRAWTRYWRHRAASATVGLLHALDDRALKDIGLDRSEIESVAFTDCQKRGRHAPERRIGMS
jgi:uncharacterized protein YjiS (DUF1127 family)